ncbi:MAG: amino acid permease [Pirellulaceae bacterium]|nr:amino acid permease [Pirellulaceae bacterium]
MLDAVSIIVGIVVGTAIFKSPTLVFQNVTSAWQGMGLWVLGGVLSLIGGLCYAELATTYPRAGGDYEYLNRAFGRWVGFLFGWAQLVVILTGSIGSMGYAFADYAAGLWNLPHESTVWLAAGAIGVLTITNLLGLGVGKTAQHVLSGAKTLGLVGVIGLGLFATPAPQLPAERLNVEPSLGLALVFVLYAYGGWNDAAFVAAEVRNRRRNLPLALLLGILGITVVYLLVNAAYLATLGFEGARQSWTPASDVAARAVGPWGARGISLLVMVSALGAINGLILTGSRVYVSLGADHRPLAWLGYWHHRLGAPIGSLVAQGVVSLLLVFAVGTVWGRAAIDGSLTAVGLSGLPWEKYFGGFETLVAGTAPVFWLFFLLTGLSQIVLRIRDPRRPRPFATPLYPLPPLVFCATCLFMLYSSLDYARSLALLGVVPLLLGLPLYALSARR